MLDAVTLQDVKVTQSVTVASDLKQERMPAHNPERLCAGTCRAVLKASTTHVSHNTSKTILHQRIENSVARPLSTSIASKLVLVTAQKAWL